MTNTEHLNLYKWEETDTKKETIKEMAANSQKIDDEFKSHEARLIGIDKSLNKLDTSLNDLKPVVNEALSTANDLQGQLDAVIGRETDSDAMSRQAAVNAEGVDKVNLKKRLDDDFNKVTTQLAEMTTEQGDLTEFANIQWVMENPNIVQAILDMMSWQKKTAITITMPPFNANPDWDGSKGSDNTPILKQIAASIPDGGVINIPSGKFYFATDEAISLPSNITVRCVGELIFPDTRTAPLFESIEKENVNFHNLKVNGTFIDSAQNFSDTCHAISIRSCKNVYVGYCDFKNLKGDAIYISRNYVNANALVCTENVVVEHNKIHNAKRNSIAIVTGRNIKVNNNDITSDNGNWNVSSPIDLEPNRTDEVLENIQIEYNKINAVGKEIIRANIGSGKEPTIYKNITIRKNIINCINRFDGVITSLGIVINGIDRATNVDISDNEIFGDVDKGIQVYKIKRKVKVKKNTVEKAKTNGIQANLNHDDVQIDENSITLAVGSGGRSIYVYSNSGQDYSVSNNIVDNAGSTGEAIFINGNNYATSNIQAHRNHVKNAPTSMRFYQCKTTRYRDNDCAGAITTSTNTDILGRDNTISGTFPAV